MNRVTRLLAVGAMGLGAAVAIGAGPAQAASAAPATTQASSYYHWGSDDNDVVGYFNTRGACERTGRIGEARDRWDDYDCYRDNDGWNRGAWVLEVSDNDWVGNWDHNNWYGGWNNGWDGGDWHGGWNHWGHGGWGHGGDHGHGHGHFPFQKA